VRTRTHGGERCLLRAIDGSTRDAVITRVGRDFVEATTGEDRSVLLALDILAAVQSRTP